MDAGDGSAKAADGDFNYDDSVKEEGGERSLVRINNRNLMTDTNLDNRPPEPISYVFACISRIDIFYKYSVYKDDHNRFFRCRKYLTELYNKRKTLPAITEKFVLFDVYLKKNRQNEKRDPFVGEVVLFKLKERPTIANAHFANNWVGKIVNIYNDQFLAYYDTQDGQTIKLKRNTNVSLVLVQVMRGVAGVSLCLNRNFKPREQNVFYP
jgi:hypothetical protein